MVGFATIVSAQLQSEVRVFETPVLNAFDPFQVREILDAMQTDSNLKLEKLLVDGGMTKNDLLMQIQSDFLGKGPSINDITALGGGGI